MSASGLVWLAVRDLLASVALCLGGCADLRLRFSLATVRAASSCCSDGDTMRLGSLTVNGWIASKRHASNEASGSPSSQRNRRLEARGGQREVPPNKAMKGRCRSVASVE